MVQSWTGGQPIAVKKTNSKYVIRYLDKAIKPLVLIMPKINGYV